MDMDDWDPFEGEGAGAGPSLSQLVYAQQSNSSQSQVYVPVETTSGSIKKEQELIDDFYANGLDSAHKEAKKQKESKRRRKTQSQGGLRVQENVQEKEAKVAKRREIEAIRNRWKKRKLNALDEEAGGEAYRQIAKQHIKTGLAVGPTDDGFWQHGLSAPSKPALPAPCKVKIHKQMLPPETDRRTDFGRWTKVDVRTYPTLLFPFPHLLAKAPREFHRSVAIQIGRKGLRSVQDDSHSDYRLLSNMLRCHRTGDDQQLIRSREMGQNMKIFHGYKWKNTMEAAEQLGVASLLVQGEMPVTIKKDHRQGDHTRAAVLRKYKQSKLDEETANPFTFEPGAVPPSPTHDNELLLNTVFCSKDPNRNVLHRQARKIDMTSARAVFSTLLKELGSTTTNRKEKVRAQQRIQTFVDMLVPTCRVDTGSMINRNKMPNTAIPVVPEYESLLMACSYIVANSTSQPSKEEEGDDDDDASNQQTCDYQALGLELCALLETPLKRTEVISFPQLFLTQALAFIARELPSSAAKLLATTESKRSFRSVRTLLEFLEMEEMLIEKEEEGIEKQNAVMVGNLEHVFHLAAEAIAAEYQRTDYDVDYVAWTVALRLASVLLCSGNRIGGPSHVHRSHRQSSNTEAFFSQIGDEEDCLDHEVRICLPKYEESRVKAAESMQKLLTGTPGEAQSSYIVTLLQWSQAIALVTGPSEKSPKRDARYKQIRSIHAKHKVRSHDLLMSGALQELQRQGRLGDACLVDRLACNVEVDPSCLEHWRELVTQLGPFAIGGSCKCSECGLLRNNCQLAVHHDVQVDCVRWDHDRKLWWNSCLLTIPTVQEDVMDDKNTGKVAARDLCHGIEQRMSDEKEYCFQKLPSSKEDDEPMSEEEENNEWLDQVCDDFRKGEDESTSEVECDMKPSLSARAIAVDAWLPNEAYANYDASELNETAGEWSSSPVIPTLSESSKSVEGIALKVCILVHLYGPSHKNVAEGVFYLAQLWRRNNDEGDAWACLCWLSAQGLNVSKIIRTRCHSHLNWCDSNRRSSVAS